MRYLGGLLGGTWLTALSGDLGHGIFDGANLVANFESLNPANTYWTKAYNVYSKVDTERRALPRLRDLVGQPGAAECRRDAVDRGQPVRRQPPGDRPDPHVRRRAHRSAQHHSRRSSCSARGATTSRRRSRRCDWVLDLYDHEREIVANGQTIVYTMHQTIGHLGIFVSGKVAAKEHGEFVSCMEMIEVLPPGLYEAVITEVDENTVNRDLVQGKYLFRLEARTLDDIRALGGNDAADDARFATVGARIRDQPRALPHRRSPGCARHGRPNRPRRRMRALHPNRLRFAMFSDQNPFMQPVKAVAESVRAARQPVSAGQSAAGDGASSPRRGSPPAWKPTASSATP